MFLVTRFAGVEAFGILTILTAMSSMMGNLASFRTNEAVVAFYKRSSLSGDKEMAKLTLVLAFLIDTAISIILFTIVYFFSETIASVLLKTPSSTEAVRLYAIYFFAIVIRSSSIGYLQAREKFLIISSVSVSEYFSKVGVVLFFVLTLGTLELRHVIIALVLSSLTTSTIFCYFLIKRYIDTYHQVPLVINRNILLNFLSFSANTFLSSSLKAGHQNIDTLVVGAVTTTETAGIYGMFRQFLSPVLFISNPFSAIAYPRFVDATTRRSLREIYSLIINICSKLLVLDLVIISFIWLTLFFYLRYLNFSTTYVHWIVFSFMTLTTLSVQQVWWSRALSNSINPSYSLWSNIISFLVVSSLIYPAVQEFNLFGAASVMLINSIIQNAYWFAKLNTIKRTPLA